MRRRLLLAAVRALSLWPKLRGWVVRAAMFYFGYRILHHEVYDVDHADALLVFVGLWLCGLPPLTLLSQLRDAGLDLKSNLERLTEDAPEDRRQRTISTDERESGGKE